MISLSLVKIRGEISERFHAEISKRIPEDISEGTTGEVNPQEIIQKAFADIYEFINH